MKKLLYLSLIIFIALLTGCMRPSKVLVVVGGHAYDTLEFYQMFDALDRVEFDSVSHPRAMELLASEQALLYDVLVFYDFIPAMELKDSLVYQNLTRRGLPLLFMHHSLCNFQLWKGYEDMLGGKYVMSDFGEDSLNFSDYAHDLDLNIQVLDPNHRIAKGIEDFTIHDEGYSNIRVSPDIHPLFATAHPQSAPMMGWIHTHQNSSVVYLMFGHDKLAYENESFRQILSNSIHWLSKR